MRLLLLLLPLLVLPADAAEDGLLAHWSFDEGSGETLKDSVGQAHGAIHGATWVKSGDGWALSFDGVDDYVDCGNPPALSPTSQITVEVWINPTKAPGVGEPGVIGKAYHNYALTYYTDGKCWWYTGESGQNVKANVSPGGWHHVVGTLDGKSMHLYVDGEHVGSSPGTGKPMAATENFFFGTSKGSEEFTKKATFGGLIDEARVYGRALTPEEVLQHYRTTKLTRQVEVTVFPYYASREVLAQLDLRGLGELPAGISVNASLVPKGQTKALATGKVSGVESFGRTRVSLKCKDLREGEYEVRVQALDAKGKPFGLPNSARLVWPKAPAWEVKDPNIKILNNLVSELRNVSNLAQPVTKLKFTNPREGWVYFKLTGSGRQGAVTVTVPAAGDLREVIVLDLAKGREAEVMRRLPLGSHELTVACAGGAKAANLVVRSIPEIGYCRVDAGPQLAPYGPADWAFLEKYILPNINLAVSRGDPAERERLAAWKAQGKRWIVETPLPGLGKADGVPADEVYQKWIEGGRVAEPLLDGMIVDEFGAGDEPIWQSWHEGLKRLRDTPEFKGKVFYPYCGPLYGAKASREFAQTCLDAGWAVALERYLPEEHTEEAARAAIHAAVLNVARDWQAVQPEVIRHMLIVWGFMISTPPEQTNVDPGVDFKAFADMQMHMIANEPTFFGLYGVTSYLSAYSEEEIIRFHGALYRHYCIEGRTDRLTENYELPHLRNPDFETGLEGWKAAPAGADGITTATVEGLSWLEGRYPPVKRGNTCAIFRRSAGGQNALTQQAVQLKPGQLYSLKMISADLDDFEKGSSSSRVLPLKVEVEGVEVLPERTFQHPYSSCYSHQHGPFNRENRMWLNMHNVLFRAKSPTAVVRISETGEGEAGDRIMFNFLELEPYYESK